MNQRHIILIVFILLGVGFSFLDRVNNGAIRTSLDGTLGPDRAQMALLSYILFIGVYAGFEIRGFFQPVPAAARPPSPGRTRRRGSFERQYREAIYGRYRDLLATGVQNQQNTLEQEHIFEPPFLSLTDAQPGPTDPAKDYAAALQSIWQHLAIPPRRLLPSFFRPESQHRHFVILGMPGGGKSTLLQHIALTFVRRQHLTFNPPIRELMPILLVLRDHLDAIKANPQVDIAQLITVFARSRLDLTAASASWFTSHLRDGSCIVLLDGLDEIADAQDRKLMAAWVQAQLGRWNNNYVVITSRPHGYVNNPLNGVRILTVEPFTAPQVESFVRKWYPLCSVPPAILLVVHLMRAAF
ncbi:NACHT domain-containing protein [Oscillochloris sp. ZM17-4]|uniref:NACHT domain-containing protein n=1 Tax=Oscillochloris sp. ZM17-4 TaxID=2866714 RepID=UPI001C7310C8|nr:NACHT domain-containing protein [Oscillochloris sp. ZM17-4]MBX0327424.1 NACHT domain-containing protein [Oscillochloris sp. ZM17-4]